MSTSKNARHAPGQRGNCAQSLADAAREACYAEGVEFRDVPADGRIHRLDVADDPHGKGDATIKLFADGEGGWVKNYKGTGKQVFFWARQETHLNPAELEARRKRQAEERKAAKREQERQWSQAAKKAQADWLSYGPAPSNLPQLAGKGILDAYGCKVTLDGRLATPVYSADDQIQAIQYRHADGQKRNFKDAKMEGGFWWIGTPAPDGDLPVLVTTSFSTAASIYQAMGGQCLVYITYGDSGLEAVGRMVKARHPGRTILLCGDDDVGKPGNPGRTKAEAVSKALALPVVFPDFGPNRPEGTTDFNDLAATAGPEAVQQQIAAALAGAPAVEVAAQEVALEDQPATDTGEANDFPPPEQRPCWRVYDDWCGPKGKRPPGVYYHSMTPGGENKKPHPMDVRVCSPLHVEAVTCTDDGRNFGRLLRFLDTYGRWRHWAMPMEALGGSCEELRRELLAAGAQIEHRERNRLPDYLQWRVPERRVLAAIRTGWTRDGLAFVLPEHVIGSADVYYQAETMHQEGTAEKGGSFDAWKAEVAALCAGNLVLAVSVCVALAGPLLAKIHQDSGGIHWTGDSSIGKTTSLNVGGSVWGGDTYRRTWRATANGLEGAAAALNDSCLCLDEISEADPREIGAVVYALGNGTGKSRASRTGAARNTFRWRLTLLSTGERTLGAQMAESGKQPKAGQELRLLSIPAARTHGAFDTLHRFPTGRALADHLKTATRQHYGHAGPAFIEAILRDGRDFGEALAEVEALPQFQAENSQEARAASRFALYGMAGELAVEWGILPWPEGQALSAAAEAFRLWRGIRGKGTTEDRQILQAVADFTSRHGDARFSRKGDTQAMIRERAGWWTDAGDGRIYLFTGEALREATKGYDLGRALNALDMAGWIHGRDPGKQSKVTDIGNRQKQRLYWILPGDLDE